ncbi:hypothetical protein C0033_07590 [Clostridium sp. chh4-2]|uniref:hypothetical protein n=1 Tax=Clostridium sp. chh4-2 TaxID=2067550 RepID=UPI000CCF31E5|nr:hypothetical protein [Clostridium sp. chh4-2]PNV62868.1 hypothetical protein C0033_07590 [Clostridium sp. chh4-2]
MIDNEEMPIGFTLALSQNTDSMIKFSNLSTSEQERIIDRARQIKSRKEMHQYVSNLSSNEGGKFS